MAKVGASSTISFVMPDKRVKKEEIWHWGFTNVENLSTTCKPSCIRMQISMIAPFFSSNFPPQVSISIMANMIYSYKFRLKNYVPQNEWNLAYSDFVLENKIIGDFKKVLFS